MGQEKHKKNGLSQIKQEMIIREEEDVITEVIVGHNPEPHNPKGLKLKATATRLQARHYAVREHQSQRADRQHSHYPSKG